MKQILSDEYGNSTRTEVGAKLGITLIEAHECKTVMSMPVEGNRQVVGALHGGATAALCETAASTAALIHAHNLVGDTEDEKDWNKTRDSSNHRYTSVGTELTISHVRSAWEGTVTAVAESIHLGRTSTVHSVTVKDERGRVISTALATNRIIETR